MHRNIRSLLKRNRRLERKIFYDPRPNDWREKLITRSELLKALAQIANRVVNSESAELSVLKLVNQVSFIKGRPMGDYEKNALQVVDIIFNYLRINTEFDQRFYRILNSLQMAFVRVSLDDLSLLNNPKHSAVTFLERLLNVGYHFDEKAGRLTQYFVQAIELLVDKLARKEQISTKTFSIAHARLDQYFVTFEKNIKLTKRKLLIEIEKKSRQIQADYHTSQLINEKTEGDEIPIFLLDFFENQLSHVIHRIILKFGLESIQCKRLLKDMDIIYWSITSTIHKLDYSKKYEKEVVSAMKRLYKWFKDENLFNQYVESFFVEIEELHRKKLDGQRVQLDMMISANIFDDEKSTPEPSRVWGRMPQDIIDIKSLKQGNWYNLSIDGQKVRSELLMINELTEELYFVNLSGEHLQTISFEDQSYLAQHLEIFKLDETIHYKHAIKAIENELASNLQVLEVEYDTFKQQAIIDEKQRKQLEERARKAVLQGIEREKRITEEKRLAAQQQKRKELDEIIRQEKIEAENRLKAKGVLRKMGPGSLVTIEQESGKLIEASLMLISRTTGRYIFADYSGNKIMDPTKNQLIDMINQQLIKIIKIKSDETDRMQSLVAQRRQQLSQRYI